MAKKDKKIKTEYGIYYAGGKFRCDDCDHELHQEENCPVCHKQVDWDKAMIQLRSRGMG